MSINDICEDKVTSCCQNIVMEIIIIIIIPLRGKPDINPNGKTTSCDPKRRKFAAISSRK